MLENMQQQASVPQAMTPSGMQYAVYLTVIIGGLPSRYE